MIIQNNAVLVQNVICLWDGISKPDEDGKFSCSFALAPSAPELTELQGLVQKAVASQQAWAGTLKGRNPLTLPVDAVKYGDQFQGMLRINTGTQFPVTVVDANNQVVNPMALSQHIYAGAKIHVIISSAYAYDTAGNSGVKFNIDGVMVVDNTLPKLAGGGFDASSAFAAAGFGGGMAPQAAAPVGGAPMGQAPAPAALAANHAAQQAVAASTQAVPDGAALINPNPAAPAPVLQPAAPVTPVKVYVHTDPTVTKEQYQAHDAAWTEEMLVSQGKGRWEEQAPAAAPVSAPAAPAAPTGVQPAHDFLQQPGVTPQ